METLVVFIIGSPVTWINPEELPAEAEFIRKEAQRHGTKGLAVHQVRLIGEQMFLALYKHGEVILEQSGKPLWVNSRFLRRL